MAFLELNGIGKIYTGENGATVGIRGVNLSFERGELVAITGISGSGKSTLLNVISGMDTYEEGELLIEGEQTSHFVASDWESYREKYISFIFQDYNIIDSFTVLENVELALMHIKDTNARRSRAIELLTRVGLAGQLHQKGSKLSGGQKQRTVIARALAKDSPIVLADEPTGNLDSATSKEIIDLLCEVCRDKLLIIVTHNFDQLSHVATRHIRVFDSAVVGDDTISKANIISEPFDTQSVSKSKKELLSDGFILGRAIFKAKPRLTAFLCILMILGTLGVFFATSTCGSGVMELLKPNYMFEHIDGRLVLAKKDGSSISDEEFKKLVEQSGCTDSLRYDLLLDTDNGTSDFSSYYFDYGSSFTPNTAAIPYGDYYRNIDVSCAYGKSFGNNIMGRYPAERNEVFLYLPISCVDSYGKGELKNDKVFINSLQLKVCGVKYYYDNNITPVCLFTKEGMQDMTSVYYLLSKTKLEIGASTNGNESKMYSTLVPSYLAEDGMAYISDGEILNNIDKAKISIVSYYAENTDMYSVGEMSYKSEIDHAHLTKTPPSVTNPVIIDDYGEKHSYYSDMSVIVSPTLLFDMANEILGENYGQCSLFFENDKQAAAAREKLNGEQYAAVLSTTKTYADSVDAIIYILGSFMLAGVWLVIIVFLAFFIDLCSSRAIGAFKSDMAIMRSMGISVSTIKIGMYARMLLSLMPAFVLAVVCAVVIYSTPSLNGKFTYLYFWQYALIFVGMLLLTVRITHRQVKKLFGESVKKSLKGGVE